MKSLVVTKEYRDGFIRAFVTFKHQMVYCPMKRQQVRLYPPPPHVTDEQLRHAGIEVDEDLALQLALGNYDPFKLKKLHDYNPDDLSVSFKFQLVIFKLLLYFLFVYLEKNSANKFLD